MQLVGAHESKVVFVDSDGRPLQAYRRRVDRAALVELKRVYSRCRLDEPGFGNGDEVGGEPLAGHGAGNAAGDGVDGDLRFVGLEEIPDVIDARWWARHAKLIQMRGGRGLEFHEGFVKSGADEPPVAAAGIDAAGIDAAGIDAAGIDAAGIDAAGIDAAGIDIGEMSAGWGEPVGLVGREAVVARLSREALGCARRDQVFPHMLLAGPPGTGKTTLAVAVARAYGVRMHRAMGTMIQDVPALLRLITGLGEGDCLFVDEIHAMPRAVIETLYEAMEERQLSLTLHSGNRSRCVCLCLPKVTILAATTEPADLPPALMSRFGVVEYLPYYEVEELTRILLARAEEDGVELARKAAQRIALCGRGTPREALRLMDSVFNQLAARGFQLTRGERVLERVLERVTLKRVAKVLSELGYSEEGLSALEQRYLRILRDQCGPVSLHRLAQALGCPEATVKSGIEPRLSGEGLVLFTPRGRVPGAGYGSHRSESGRPILLDSCAGSDRGIGLAGSLSIEASSELNGAGRIFERPAEWSSAVWNSAERSSAQRSSAQRSSAQRSSAQRSSAGWGSAVWAPESGRTGQSVVDGDRGLARPG